MLKNKTKGFSLVELIVIIAILAVFAATLIPSLLQYTENSRAQKDVSAMDEVVNAFQLAMADEDCYDEMLQYSCTNNYITYTDSSGVYGQIIADGEFWAPDGSGRATTITFNPSYEGDKVVYRMDEAIVNDMTYGNGSAAQSRVMEGALIEDNQCYFKNASINGGATGYTYNRVRQSIGEVLEPTSQTYRNSSFTVFILFTQKDGTIVADVNGSFNGTNVYEGAVASLGSGTFEYDDNGDAITTVTTPGTTTSEYDVSALSGSGTFYPEYKNGIIPSDGQYTTSDGIILEAGQTKRRPQTGDIYKDTYYEYRYNQYCTRMGSGEFVWETNEAQNGWGVRILTRGLRSYGNMQPIINGKPVNTLRYTFYDCPNLTTAPVLHNGITSMYYAFSNCKKLQAAPEIPDGVINLNHTFQNCQSMLTPPSKIPDSVKYMSDTFSQCKSLKYVSDIPSGIVGSMFATFSGCDSIVDLSNIKIPAGVTSVSHICYGCDNLKYAPDFSNATDLTDMTSAFNMCKSLIVAPVIPNGVTDLQQTFKDCAALTTPPLIIPNSVTDMIRTFSGCSSLTVAPQLPGKDVTAWNTFENCTSLIVVPAIPNGVRSLQYTFMGCTSLTTAPVIADSVVYMIGTFKDCTALTAAPIIPRSTRYIGCAFEGCASLSGTITINGNILGWTKCLYNTNITDVNGATKQAAYILLTKTSTATNPKT